MSLSITQLDSLFEGDHSYDESGIELSVECEWIIKSDIFDFPNRRRKAEKWVRLSQHSII